MFTYYFHRDTKRIYSLLDDRVCYMWADREKDFDLIFNYYPIYEMMGSGKTFIIEADEFEELFIPIDEDNFDEIHDEFGFDEVIKHKIKKEMFKILED